MNNGKYPMPACIREKCDPTRYSKWLKAKANAHVRRDRRRLGNDRCRVAKYKAAIHSAVSEDGNRDHYTGELLNWSLISKFRNDAAKKGEPEYKKKFALLPTVDHTLDEQGHPMFDEAGCPRIVICSWRVNDAKGDMTQTEFRELCALVLEWHQHRQASHPGLKELLLGSGPRFDNLVP